MLGHQIFSKLQSSKTIFIHDLLMIPIAWLGAYWLRYNLGEIPESAWQLAITYLPFILIIQAISSRFFGLYRGVWRFASLPDLLRIGKAVFSGALIIAVVLFFYDRLDGVPRSVLPLYAILLVLLLSAPRFFYRFWKDQRASLHVGGKRTLIVGAGHAGDMLLRDLLSESNTEYTPIIFVDDDKNKRRREVRGVRVAGSIRKIPKLVEQYRIEAVLIAVPSAKDQEMQRIVEICESCGIPFLTLPSVGEILSGKITREALREVSIDDLLGRDPVKLEWDNIRSSLENKSILVTGGGGSIGSELCRQLAKLSPHQLIIFEKSEFNLYKIEGELKAQYPGLSVKALLGDVVDRAAVRHMMEKYRPDVVFHAAAYKHVPLLESQAREAVRNNVIGTCNIAQEAIRAGVDEFVLISTDKAVNPTNIMGATKRSAEIFCQTMDNETGTRFITVRFGNVLGSAGSVVPLFREQIKRGGPITVTDPNITRFFMTIPEASQLIMEAASVGKGGEIFVLDMGEPIKIGYLAEQMIRLSGKVPGVDIDIEYIGLRPGEKMYEELFHEDEDLAETKHNKLFLSKSREPVSDIVMALPKCLEKPCQDFDDEKLRAILNELVPEYSEDVSEQGFDTSMNELS